MDETKKPGIGGTIGTIIIIALIVLGGLYFWGKRLEESKIVDQTDQTNVQTQATLSAEQQEIADIKNTASSDDIGSIEADLNNTNLNNLTPEL